jgi:hypothetical protein
MVPARVTALIEGSEEMRSVFILDWALPIPEPTPSPHGN